MYVRDATVDSIVEAVRSLTPGANDVVLLLIGEEGRPNMEALIEELNASEVKFFGGIFPGVIHDDQRSLSGAIVQTLPALEAPVLFQSLKDEPHVINELPYRMVDLATCIKGVLDQDGTGVSSRL